MATLNKQLNSRFYQFWSRPKPFQFFFGASLSRVSVETGLIALILFWLGSAAPVLVEYRLLAIQYLPGGLLACLWAALRLRKLAPNSKRRVFWLTPLVGLSITSIMVLLAFVLSLLKYHITDLVSPVLPDLFTNASNVVNLAVFRIADPLLSWPYSFDPAVPAPLILIVRLLIYAIELALVFTVFRSLVGLLSLPADRLARLTERKLLWRLAFSHFWVVLIALTTALVLAASLFLLISSQKQSSDRNGRNIAAFDARNIAATITLEDLSNPLTVDQMDAFLRQVAFNPFEPGNGLFASFNASARIQNMLHEMPNNSRLNGDLWPLYIAITDLQGNIIASSSPSRLPEGKNFKQSPVGLNYQTEWSNLLNQLNNGETDLGKLTTTRLQPPMLIAGAYPIKNRVGLTEEYVLLAERPEIAVVYSGQGLISLISIGAVVVGGGLIISVITMLVALLFGFLLSRRLVGQIEQLTLAADQMATGQLKQRVPLNGQDELNQLATRFNLMAQNLQQSQANLEEEKNKAETALAYKRELVANVSHELRTPVATIRAYIDWLLREVAPATPAADSGTPPADELYSYLGIIGRETERLSGLIEDLLDLSRIEGQGLNQTLNLETVSVAELAQEIQQALGPMAQRERKIKLILNLPTETIWVKADRQRLAQVLLNLVRNAINYTPAGGIISIGAEQDEAQHGLIWVADTGIGIAPDELQRVFERFYRSDSSRSRHTGGAGLGLAIVKALVEAMDGTISVESKIGEGSKFNVQLPLAEPSDAPVAS